MSARIDRVLLVAPANSLQFGPAEVADIANAWRGRDLTVLQGAVTIRELVRQVREIPPGDDGGRALMLLTHSNSSGIELSDGVLVNESLTALCRHRFHLIVLNSCSTQAAAQQIQNETGAAVVCTVLDVPDQLAYVTGGEFAQELARSGDPGSAYAKAHPGGNRTYLYLGSAAFLAGQPVP